MADSLPALLKQGQIGMSVQQTSTYLLESRGLSSEEELAEVIALLKSDGDLSLAAAKALISLLKVPPEKQYVTLKFPHQCLSGKGKSQPPESLPLLSQKILHVSRSSLNWAWRESLSSTMKSRKMKLFLVTSLAKVCTPTIFVPSHR